ncbi:serine/threonine-protein kinase [Streptomyces marincola]|uniref:Protein kinase domain-containing protein n=1 Tax=Streptomyces marincola TaxID=2878388 RepID=A0A1W7D2X9_9ACTN|nr:serine/threonine-protein kinase [Streptomyces marincola]ARQ71317.1 hypothetical protein CAG99_23020 [Streptomyces marincola]
MEPLSPGDPFAVGPYRLLGRLGAGGMGQVFLGRSPNGRTAAVKLVHADLAADAEFRRRFRHEVAAARRVSGRWTAPVLDSDTDSAVPWVATGYVPGPSLSHVVGALHGPLPEDAVWVLADGLARALTDIHGGGLIHRDLKPSNILVTLEGPRVIDFGIARAVDASLATRTGSLIGSPGYMPPEQVRGEELTGAADVFAFGAVLVFAATGTGPFGAGDPALHTLLYRVVHEEAELGPEPGPLAGPLRELAARCLTKDPAERPTVAEILGLTGGRGGTDADGGLWLPAALTARLGRDAAGLLALEDPSPTRLDPPRPAAPPTPPPGTPAAPPTPPPGTPAVPPTPHPGAPTITAVPGGARPAAPTRRRRLVAVAAGVAAVVAVAAVVVAATRSSGEDEPRAEGPAPRESAVPGTTGDPGGGDAGGNDTEADEAGGGEEPGAPLHHLLPAYVQEAGEIEVWAAANYPPVLFRDDANDRAGIEAEIAAALSERLGVEFTFRQGDYPSLLLTLSNLSLAGESGHIGMGVLSATAEERHDLGLDFVNHYRDGWVLMVPAGEAESVDAIGDLCGRTLATWEGDEVAELVARYSGGCADPVGLSEQDDVAAMADSVRTGEADAVLVQYSGAVGHLAEAGNEDLVLVGEQMDVTHMGIPVSQGEPELRDALQEALQSLIDDGTYGEILDRWNAPGLAVESATVNAGE